MRSLPWLKDESDSSSSNPLKRKRKQAPVSDTDAPKPSRAKTPEVVESSDSEETIILDSNGDSAFDAMIPGYENDDAYIMVEHDFIEAAKQVTRHLHLEAYQKHATAPVSAAEILRPTTGAPERRPQVEGESDDNDDSDADGKDVSTLGELLRLRPAAVPIAATPIKPKNPTATVIRDRDSGNEVRKLDIMRDSRAVQTKVENIDVGGDHGSTTSRRINTHVQKSIEADEDEDEDEEDLDRRPQKVLRSIAQPKIQTTTINPPQTRPTSSKIQNTHPSTSSRLPPPAKPTKKPYTKPALDVDWMFDSLWEPPQRPTRSSATSNKVSLASQLEETSLKLLGQKKAISLKDQFKFMES
jgi:hypothetical protein